MKRAAILVTGLLVLSYASYAGYALTRNDVRLQEPLQALASASKQQLHSQIDLPILKSVVQEVDTYGEVHVLRFTTFALGGPVQTFAAGRVGADGPEVMVGGMLNRGADEEYVAFLNKVQANKKADQPTEQY